MGNSKLNQSRRDSVSIIETYESRFPVETTAYTNQSQPTVKHWDAKEDTRYIFTGSLDGSPGHWSPAPFVVQSKHQLDHLPAPF